MRAITRAGIILTGAATTYVLAARGSLVVDVGIGRRIRRLGPFTLTIAAPPETVFDVVAKPYLGRTPKAMEHKLHVIERGQDMALAAHYTPVFGSFLTATTIETVRFERPGRITFRLLRGPVPHVVETFELRPVENGTEFEYDGEMGADFWRLGEWWSRAVGQRWERAVQESLDTMRAEAERRSSVGHRSVS
jgi:hypothetical protein